MNPVQTYLSALQATLEQLPEETIQKVIDVLHQARQESRTIYIMGNGGSASTASHFVCDLNKNTRNVAWPDFKVLGLTDNMALFSALANDEGYENVFALQLSSFVQPGDIVIGISTSGKSPNVVEAFRLARMRKALTIGFTGFDGGHLADLSDIHVHVPSDCIEHVEDIHLVLEHLICKTLREMALRAAFEAGNGLVKV